MLRRAISAQGYGDFVDRVVASWQELKALLNAPPQASTVELVDAHADLVLGTETGGARYQTGAYGFWSAHVRSLLVDAGIDDPDAMVDHLLAPVSAEVYLQQRGRGLTRAQITQALDRLALAVLPGDTG